MKEMNSKERKATQRFFADDSFASSAVKKYAE